MLYRDDPVYVESEYYAAISRRYLGRLKQDSLVPLF